MSAKPPEPRPGFAAPEAMIGIGLLVCAALVAWQTAIMPVSPMYSKVGPTVFPYMTAAGLAVLAGLLFLEALRGGWQPQDEKEVKVSWKAVAFVFAGLLANVVLIRPLGFTAASVVLFVLVAHGFGSRRPLSNALIGTGAVARRLFRLRQGARRQHRRRRHREADRSLARRWTRSRSLRMASASRFRSPT